MSHKARQSAADAISRSVRIDLTPAEACVLLDALVLEASSSRSESRRAQARSCFARVKLSRDDARKRSEARELGRLP